MTEERSTRFELVGARAVLEHLGNPAALELNISTLERAVSQNPALAVDVAKSLVETACKAICRERGCTPDDNCDLQKLVRLTSDALQLTPGGHRRPGELRRGLGKALSGLSAVVQGIAEVRNIEGSVSHGKDVDWTSIGQAQAELVARAADTVVHFLYMAHLGQAAKPGVPKLRYEDNPDFNASIDDMSEPVMILDSPYRPSEVLFYVDNEAYRAALSQFVPQVPAVETASAVGT
jgi:hypothetical protein